MRFVWGLILAVALTSGCTREPLADRAGALRETAAPVLADDLGQADLFAALEQHAAFLSTLNPQTKLHFGGASIAATDYARALDSILRAARLQVSDPDAFYRLVRDNFDFFEVYGQDRWGEIRLTSYYEAEMRGALARSAEFNTPLLGRPNDLVEVASSRFDNRLADAGTLRGRLWRDPGRGRDLLVPYYSRAEIEGGALRQQGLELAWVDPIDAFFMQVQGSGTVVLPGEKRLRLGYSDQNGHRYHSIGKFLTDVIPLEKMSLFTIEQHLKSLPLEGVRRVLNRNPSYVFFEKIEGAPRTSLGNPVFAGRTLAADSRYFPKGALAFLSFEKPVFASPAEPEPMGWQPVSRFVFDQDTGGAIKGGGRADLFWGAGADAKRHAGFIKGMARLYYLLPKPSLLEVPATEQLSPADPSVADPPAASVDAPHPFGGDPF